MKKTIIFLLTFLHLCEAMEIKTNNKLPCPHCQKLISRNGLTSHISTHTETEKVPCPTCSKEFSKYRLIAHIKYMHSNEKKPCPTCKEPLTRGQWQKHPHTKRGTAVWSDQNEKNIDLIKKRNFDHALLSNWENIHALFSLLDESDIYQKKKKIQ